MLQVDAMPIWRLAEIVVVETHRAQHGAARRLGDAVDYHTGIAALVVRPTGTVVILLAHGTPPAL